MRILITQHLRLFEDSVSVRNVSRSLMLIGSLLLFTACGGGGDAGGSSGASNGSEAAGTGATVESGDGSDNSDNPNSNDDAVNTVDETTGYIRPVVTSLWSDTTALGEGRIVDDTIAFSGTAEAYQIIEIWLNDELAGSTIADHDGNWLFDYRTVPLAMGDYSVRVVSVARSGVQTAALGNFNFSYDPSPPAAPSVDAVNGDSYIVGDGFTTDGTLLISGSAESSSTVRVYVDGVEIGTSVADENNAWQFDYTDVDLADGNYQITADAELMGLVGAMSSPFVLVVDRVAPAAPTFSAVSPDNGFSNSDTITNGTSLVFSGSAEAYVRIRVRLDGDVVGGADADAAGNWVFDYQSFLFEDGEYLLELEATDRAGNQSSWSAPSSFTIDTVAPTVASNIQISPDTGIVGDGITNTGALLIQGNAEANALVNVIINGASAAVVNVDSDGNWLLDLTSSPLAGGVYGIQTQVNDLAGNQSPLSTAMVIVVESALPAAPVVMGIAVDSAQAGDFITNICIIRSSLIMEMKHLVK